MSGPQLFCVKHLRESLLTSASASPCSQTGGCRTALAFCGQHGVVCCHHENIDQIPLNNYFPAQSLHLRYGSAAPCPTLRAHVTTSLPRTRYGRLATPYPTGLPCCVLPAYKDCSRSQWKTALCAVFSVRTSSRCRNHSPHPSQNRTCAINAYGSSFHICTCL